MKRPFQSYKRMFLSAAVILSFSIQVSFNQSVIAQHEGHVMPGVSKPKPKSAARRKPKRKIRRRASAKRPQVNKSTGTPAPAGHKHTPGMVMPAPTASPAAPVPAGHEHTPGMVMPAPTASPASSGVPQTPQHDVHTPSSHPSPHPSPNPAQPAHDAMDHSKMTEAQPDKNAATPPAGVEHTGAHAMGPLMVMSGDDMSVRVGSSETNLLPMGQMGSGTSWTPATTPMHMIHKQSGDWLMMLHYNVIVGVNSQGGPRGVTKFESANWIMPMAFRKLGKGTLQLRGMFSFEPFTFPQGGSPLLFQTGETYKGRPIIDAQHPHDLFMELSAQYTHPLGERGTWFAYFGYPGEPALGPTAFMHRASASENPSAALSHHLQDSSHISFGVLTTGFTYRWFKLEGSVFNGREPDENRYDFEAHPWSSRSARLSFAPNTHWSMQVSHGLLKNPEALEPGDVRRTTASISYNRPFDRGNWASSLIWGRNHENHGGEIFNLNGYVAESTVNFLDKNYLYTRLELVDKNALLRDTDRLLLAITDHHPSFRIGAYTFGGARDIWGSEKISVALGSDVTFYSKPAQLDPIYGNNPVSYRFFLRFRSGKMSM
ncbi:MAG: hypothetical protein H7Z16_14835 [Pyrinomonadaceae bacterium]|nr:hypothetical protein [Pyrinomonadaceae bacterium]